MQRISYVHHNRILIGMKKLIFLAIAFCALLACSSELDDVKKEIKDLEQEALELQRRQDSIDNAIKKQHDDNEDTQNKINQTENGMHNASLLSMEFLYSDNPFQMVDNAKCEISEDGIVECWIPNIMDSKVLIPRFHYVGNDLRIEGKSAVSGETAFDFKKPLTLTVYSESTQKSYVVYVHSYTGIPMLWIDIANRAEVLSYVSYRAKLKLVEGSKTRAAGDVIEENIKIKAVGELERVSSKADGSSQMGKYDYTIVFDRVVNLLDEPMNNDFSLIANSEDRSLLRTQTALYMSQLSNLHFTPHFHYVELMLNQRYFGTYMLGDYIDYSAARTDVGLAGYIIKIDSSPSSMNFKTDNIEQPISILSPTVIYGDESFTYISDFVNAAEGALFGPDFKDADNGWQKYLDMDSFVDWYLINEIARNELGAFQADCYMNMKKNGKLRMGPVWKISRAFGYDGTSTSGFVVKNAKWFDRLFQDPAFVSRVKERFAFFYSQKDAVIQEISANAEYISSSVQENANKWQVFGANADVKSSFTREVESIKDWLERRMKWMNDEMSNL